MIDNRSIETLARLETRKITRPIGGWIRASTRLKTMISPKWTGSMPYEHRDRGHEGRQDVERRQRLDEDPDRQQQHVHQQQEDVLVVGDAGEEVAQGLAEAVDEERLGEDRRVAQQQHHDAGLERRPAPGSPAARAGRRWRTRTAPGAIATTAADRGRLGRGEDAAEDAAEDDERDRQHRQRGQAGARDGRHAGEGALDQEVHPAHHDVDRRRLEEQQQDLGHQPRQQQLRDRGAACPTASRRR